MALSGVKTVRNILLTFALIGMLTALWRASGTIAAIVCFASPLIRPEWFLLLTFLLNCLVSYLTGTSFGTSATIGVICSTIASVLGISPVLTGGAVLSGAFFGDRCSPVSTSALLVAELTGTDIYQNIRRMLRTALVPFLFTCLIYGIVGFCLHLKGNIPAVQELFSGEFLIHWTALLPAVIILLFSLFRIPVKLTMGASILTAILICLLLQHLPFSQLPVLLLTGFQASQPQLESMMNGGGILSMVHVAAIVCLSSSYAGIFKGTGLIDRFQHSIRRLAAKTSPYFAMLCTSIAAALISCNQTLTIMLSWQLAGDISGDTAETAINLEDTAVITAPLVPWSIAGTVPLTTVGAPLTGILFACYLYLVILWRCVLEGFYHADHHHG